MTNTRQEAIEWIKKIRNGSGVNRELYPETMRGRLAQKYWNDETFSYGFEYGVIHGLMIVFDIKEEELRG